MSNRVSVLPPFPIRFRMRKRKRRSLCSCFAFPFFVLCCVFVCVTCFSSYNRGSVLPPLPILFHMTRHPLPSCLQPRGSASNISDSLSYEDKKEAAAARRTTHNTTSASLLLSCVVIIGIYNRGSVLPTCPIRFRMREDKKEA